MLYKHIWKKMELDGEKWSVAPVKQRATRL